MTVYLELPFTGRWSEDETWGRMPLDDSGRCGATIRWPCRDEASRDRFARILAGDLDASPARARFAVDPCDEALAADGRRTCIVCGERPSERNRSRCWRCRGTAPPVPRADSTWGSRRGEKKARMKRAGDVMGRMFA